MPHCHRHSAAAVALLCVASLLLLAPQADAGCGTLAPTQTGGDGYIPVLGPDFRIYNAYHHQSAKVQCSDPFTGTTCAGYPSSGIDLDSAGYLPTVNWIGLAGFNFQSTMLQSNNAGVAFRCLDASDPNCFHLLIATSYLMSNNKYLFGVTCFDVTTSKLCSTNPVTILNPTFVYGTELVFGGIHSFEKYNNKAYSVDSGMNLLCFDLVNSVSCSGFPNNVLKPALQPAVAGTGHTGAVITARYLNYGGRPSLYVVVAYSTFGIAQKGARVTCVDLNTMNICSEFVGSAHDISTGAASNAFDFFFEYDSNANPISVCYFSLYSDTVASCRSLANPAIVTGAATLSLLQSVTSNSGIVHQTYFNNRMYFGTYYNKGIFCIDFSKASGPVACPNFPVVETALSKGANTNDYGASVDFAGECFFALGDQSYLYSFDSLGNVPCTVSTPPYVAPDLYLVPDKNTVLLNVLSNDANFNAASLKITSAPAGTATIVSNRIQFTPVQNVDTFTYRVCSPGFGPATASTTVTVKICPDQSDTDGDGIVNCFDLDDDNDGILDVDEGFADSDGDGIQNSLDLDSDNDGIPDYIENLRRNPTGPSSSKPSIGGIALDADGDGKIDGPVGANGIPDKIETFPDSGVLITGFTRPDFDGDGIPDNVDLDSDNDGILDSVEGYGDFDNDGYPNYLDLDSDADGICDLYENLANGPAAPNPQNAAIGPYAMDANKDCVLDDTNGDNKITLADVGNNGIIDTVETSPDSGILLPRLSHPDSDKDGSPDFLDVDSDKDGVPDLTEGNKDSDKDGIPDFRDTDSDGDGVPDSTSGGKDTDGDGIPDRDDLDDDNDGILDVVEGTGDFDGDGIPNYLDLDSDGDGICDLIENLASSPAVPSPTNPVTASGYVLDANKDCVLDDTNGDGVIDSKDVGTNGVINLVETSVDSGTLLPALSHPDTDKDGSPDFLDVDSDGDGIPDLTEGSKDTDKDGIINSRDLDSDGDGITDNHEGTKDIDKDGIPNYLDPDSDGDGIPDKIEGEIDTDGDGIPNYKDIDSDNDGILDTTEKNIDTDGDGVPDYLDLDSDDDGSSDLVESGSSNPDGRDHYTGPDSDGDGLVDEVDRNPSNFGGPANYPLRDSDGDKKPDYVDVDTKGVLDADKKSNLDPTIYDPSTGKVTGPDSDGDGIKDSIDDCVCFGGLHVRRFTVVTPTNSAWFMYDTNPISWKHNLDLNFYKLKIELVSVASKARYLLRDQYDIGPNDMSVISFSTRFSKLSTGNYYISFGVYSTDSSFSAERFVSSVFPLKTGQSN